MLPSPTSPSRILHESTNSPLRPPIRNAPLSPRDSGRASKRRRVEGDYGSEPATPTKKRDRCLPTRDQQDEDFLLNLPTPPTARKHLARRTERHLPISRQNRYLPTSLAQKYNPQSCGLSSLHLRRTSETRSSISSANITVLRIIQSKRHIPRACIRRFISNILHSFCVILQQWYVVDSCW